MAAGAKEVSSGWGIGRKRADGCEAMLGGPSSFPGRRSAKTPLWRHIASPSRFALAVSLLFGACADADNGKKNDPVIFGGAGGGNGGAGATSGVSVSW